MVAYMLKDMGFPFKKIFHGRKWVGRVCRHADGGYLGVIGKTMVHSLSEVDAFEQVVAKHLGYKSANDLHYHNATIRAQNKANRDRGRALANRFMAGDLAEKIKVIDEIFGLEPKAR